MQLVHYSVAQPLIATELQCEHLVDPIGLDKTQPRLSWIVESNERNAYQVAYRILVASSLENLDTDVGDLWDTGKIQTNDTIGIMYGGSPLGSRQRCYWKVMAWNNRDEPSEWSTHASWEMGLLSKSDWHAQWIDVQPIRTPVIIEKAEYYAVDDSLRVDVTNIVQQVVDAGESPVASNEALGGDPAFGIRKRLEVHYKVEGISMHTDVAEGATANLNNTQLPYLRRSFTVEKPVRQARLYVSALGLYEPYINGDRVGDACLAPGWTDYRKRVHYQIIDVTSHLHQGRNVLGALVGPGWFAGRAGLFHARAFYGDTPALIAQLEITYKDGTTLSVVSDESWHRHDGPIVSSDIMDGETYDARAEIDNWCAISFDDSNWMSATTREEDRNLEWAPDLPVRVLEQLPAHQVTQPTPGRWVFDLGQNMVGVARISLNESPGTVITIRHAEMLNSDGTLYRDNLRGAAATDTYVCRGGGSETWSPRFTFHGFRYVELSGLSGQPSSDAVTGIVLGSDLPSSGTFSCSDERLNQLYSNIVWGLRGNYLSIPTDCPQRDERMGWMGDAQAFIPTATYIANVAPFMTKWMQDVRDAQREDGAHSDVAPVMFRLNYGTPAWADACVLVPWTIYEMYGDIRILEENIESMTRWVDWCQEHSTDLIRDRDRGNDYGDWLSIDADTSKELIGTAYFARSTDLLARSYQTIGRTDKADQYSDLFNGIRDAFVTRYVDEDGRIMNGTQTAYLLALTFDLLPEDRRNNAIEYLIDELRGRGWRLNTGFIGVGLLLPTLDNAGHPDVAYRLLMQDEFPSWLYSVKHGATTIWERWNGWTPDEGMNDPGMNSFNHYALGSCGQWLFSGVGGIRPDDPGFTRITIQPHIGGGLTWAETSFRSVCGQIATRWDIKDDKITLNVQIPANTSATIYLPTHNITSLRESGITIYQLQGAQIVQQDANMVVLKVGSGRYTFTADYRLP
ncbi:MAG: family 78 glycoside hydrolase catalytic domain [Phycisphaerales bacterium]|nr:family 78 glycoside hydrolase catalytic domain [Phycisphaerales bacterium]